ncbi:SGNH/GDSL hydrolase family protein [Roseomonas haemaphysalidis]|uniref:SGNH/GDSL hydrolase family protein n=1 Tax=Roseomonas haemaphysalidis TaxID=2768162 RepID=A0ABS3KKX9_9PROT|nr:SGNH/GDSL hydrolase family protein [Roseomonas haemaphysalidis]MBO1078101.1 SGNH/GDSL hydrolase family protein [Roseomonas haemaphysalidis]
MADPTSPGNLALMRRVTSLDGITELFGMTATEMVRIPPGLLTGSLPALPSASVSGYALVQGQPATFDVAMTGIATVWAVLRRLGVEEGVRVQRSGNGPVVLTAGNAGSYTAALYDADAGGSLLAETSAFAVAAPAASAIITGSAPTQGQSGTFTVDLSNIAAAYVVLVRAGVEEGARVARVGDGTVLLTPLGTGSYAARVYSAAGGGVVLAETPAFTVGAAPPAGTINTPGGTIYTGAPIDLSGKLENATAGYVALASGSTEGARQAVTLSGINWTGTLTAASAGTYTARLYAAASGGAVVAESASFAVALAPVTATISGSASTAETAATFAVTVSDGSTVYAVLARSGTEEGNRVARAGNGNVSLTPQLSGAYTARVYSASTGGGMLAETAPFTVTLPALQPQPDTASMAVFGDSMTARSSAVNSTLTNLYNNGFDNWLRALSKQRLDFRAANNYGVSGNTTAQMLARVGDVVAAGLPVIRFLGGTNDANAAVPLDTTLDNYRAIFAQLRAAPATQLIIVMAVMPRSFWQDTSQATPGAAKILQYNSFLADYCATHSKMLFVDTYAAWNNGSGAPKAGFTDEGLHQTAAGAYAGAVPILAALNSRGLLSGAGWLSDINPLTLFDATNAPFGNKLLNPGLSGTAGTMAAGVTGQVADSWQVTSTVTSGQTGTIVASKEAATDGLGDWQVVTFTNRVGSNEQVTLTQSVTDASKYAAGETVRFGVEYEASGLVNVTGINIRHTDTPGSGGTNVDVRDMTPYLTTQAEATPDHSGVLRAPARTIQTIAGSGALQRVYAYVTLFSSASGGSSGKVRFRRPALVRVS